MSLSLAVLLGRRRASDLVNALRAWAIWVKFVGAPDRRIANYSSRNQSAISALKQMRLYCSVTGKSQAASPLHKKSF
jgi:hypothetical protein